MNWKIRPYREGDETQIIPLFNHIFNKSITSEYYNWKVSLSPFTLHCPTVWIAETENKLIGHYASTPMKFWINSREYTVVHDSDAMTHPDFRKEGIFTALAQAARVEFRNCGVGFMMRLANRKWNLRTDYQNYEVLKKIHWFYRPLRANSLRPRSLKDIMLQGLRNIISFASRVPEPFIRLVTHRIRISESDHANDEFDVLWDELKQYYNAVVRNKVWLNYRYTRSPGQTYHFLSAYQNGQLRGYLVYRLQANASQTVAYIVDLFTAPKDIRIRLALVYHCVQKLNVLKVETVKALAQSDTSALFFLSGFFRARAHYEIAVAPLNAEVSNIDALRDGSFFMGGDFDVV